MSKNGLILLTPTSIAYTGTSATISANGSVTFSAVSNVTLNGVFSGDYDNYIVVQIVTSNSAAGTYIRIASSGTNQTTNYTLQYLQVGGTSVTGSRTTSPTAHWTNASASTDPGGSITHIYGPNLNQPTAFRSVNVSCDPSNVVRFLDAATTHSLSASYDGLSLLPSSGSGLSGRVAVYGMRK
jgi:hypothetical protein